MGSFSTLSLHPSITCRKRDGLHVCLEEKSRKNQYFVRFEAEFRESKTHLLPQMRFRKGGRPHRFAAERRGCQEEGSALV